MSKICTGRPENPGTLTFWHDGYWFKDHDDTDYRFIRYPEPKPQKWPVRRMYGFTLGRMFVGVMTFEKPSTMAQPNYFWL